MTARELSKQLRTSPEYHKLGQKAQNARAIQYEKKHEADVAEGEILTLLSPLLEACVHEACNPNLKPHPCCPEEYGRDHGYCDDCPVEDICPSVNKDWTE